MGAQQHGRYDVAQLGQNPRRLQLNATSASIVVVQRANIARAQHALDEMQRAGAMDFPTISVALSEITRLVETHYAD